MDAITISKSAMGRMRSKLLGEIAVVNAYGGINPALLDDQELADMTELRALLGMIGTAHGDAITINLED